MLEYIQIYPETIELIARYDEAQRCRLIESMARYAFSGALPDWPDDAPEWYIWPALRQSVDRASRRAEQNRANASGPKRTKANAGETEQNRANLSKRGHTDTDTDTDILTEDEEDDDNNTHAREAADAWTSAFGSKPTPAQVYRLAAAGSCFGPGVIAKAVRLASVNADHGYAAYALSLLRDWQGEKITTLEELERYIFLRDGLNGKLEQEILSKGQSLNVSLQNKGLKIIKVMSKNESKTFKVNCY